MLKVILHPFYLLSYYPMMMLISVNTAVCFASSGAAAAHGVAVAHVSRRLDAAAD